MKRTLFILIYCAVNFLAKGQQLLQERSFKVNNLGKYIVSSAPTGTGNILYSGATLVNFSNFSSSYLMIKPDGDTLWTRQGLDDLTTEIQGLRKTPDGFLFYTTKKHPTMNAGGAVLQKLDKQGIPKWTQVNYPSSSNTGNGPVAAVNMPGKGFMLGGAFDFTGQAKNFAVAGTDSLGNILWAKGYTRSIQDNFIDLQLTYTGNIIGVGYTSHPVGPRHLKLMMFNANGDSIKGNTFVVNCPTCYESMTSGVGDILPLTDGGFLINATIDTIVGLTQTHRGMLVKVGANLQPQWYYIHRTPNTPLEGYSFTSMKELVDGTILALGYKRNPTSNNSFQLYHFSQQGTLMTTYPFQSNICNEVWGITLDALNDSTFMVGGRCGNSNSIGMYVAKVKIPNLPAVKPPLIIAGTKEESVTEIGLGQSYPNPTAAEAIIPYNLPKNYRKATITIREIATGREIRKYALKRNESTLKVEVSNLSNGLYLYSLEVDDNPIATKKLAVMK